MNIESFTSGINNTNLIYILTINDSTCNMCYSIIYIFYTKITFFIYKIIDKYYYMKGGEKYGIYKT